MDNQKKYKLLDLIEDIKAVDEMINIHSSNPTTFMLKQYQSKKEKLMGYLIDELLAPGTRSAKSFFVIKNVIDKFYPNLAHESKSDFSHQELNEIESVLAL